MFNRSKKLISLFVLLTLVLSLFIPVSAVSLSERERARLEGFGLMQGHDDGTFGEDEELTRAQMCTIAARILQIENIQTGVSTFTDVPDNHWAAGVIATLSQAGIVNGMGDGTFMPDKSVSYFEAVKILVSVLGYGSIAEDKGGYPNGYLAQASNLGLLRNVTATEGAVSRGDIAKMLCQALDVKPIGYHFTQNYPEAYYTLEEILEDVGDLVQFTGILTETAKSSLAAAEPSVKEGNVIIGNTRLLCDVPMEDYLGCELIVYAYLDSETDKYRIKSFTVSRDTVVTVVDAEAVVWNGNEITILDEEGDEEDEMTLLGTAKVLYNGRLATIPSDERKITYGSYTFIDRGEDDVVDVMFMNEAQSFVIDKINTSTQTIYFKDRATLNGRNAVCLDNEKYDTEISLTDVEGNELSVSDLSVDTAITMFASKDQNYIKAIVSEDNVVGKITTVKVDGIEIEGVFYELAKKPNGAANFEPKVGEEATYILDCFGKVAGSTEAIQTSYQYVYIINAKYGSGLNSSVSLQTITGQEPEKEVTVSAGEELISYYFRNNPVEVYDCAAKCSVNIYQYDLDKDVYLAGVKRDMSDVELSELTGNMAALRLNSEGKVRDIYVIPAGQIGSGFAFNANILSFGGENVATRGYASDKNTMFICVPETYDSIEDYYVQVKIADEAAENKVTGGVFFPDFGYEKMIAEPADIVLIQAKMDSAVTVSVSPDADICIVGEVLNQLDDSGELVYAIEMLNGGTIQTLTAKGGSKAETVARSLRKGDLIRYAKDGKGQMTNIEKLVSVQGLGNSYSSNIHISSGTESGMYGLALHTVPGEYDYFSNQIVDWLTLVFEEDGSVDSGEYEYRLFHEDMPTIYKYERKAGNISEGYIEDIRSYDQVGSDADKILAIIKANDIKALVIIVD